MSEGQLPARADVVICGGGHNGLVAAVLLARRGLDVVVVERADVVGGAARTEYPFGRAPQLGASTGAYLFGLMPPELVAELGIDFELSRRDPHYFLPTTGNRYLLFGRDQAAATEQIESMFSAADARAYQALMTELDQLRADVGPTWLDEPLTIEDTAERFVRPALRRTFIELCRGSIGEYLGRFGFESDLLQAMFAVTDGFSGMRGSWTTPGTGMNFLVHNMCRLPDAGGTWMVPKGGMGAVTGKLAAAARAAGARIVSGQPVRQIGVTGGRVSDVTTARGDRIDTQVVICNADPFRMLDLVGRDRLPAAYLARIDGYRRDGTTLKLNLALRGLPRFRCLTEDLGQHRGTIHLLPEGDVIGTLQEAFASVCAGRLAEFPTIEWYIHTTVDPTLRDDAGHHSSALFVQWVPYRLAESSWDQQAERYADHLLSLCDRFAPGTSDQVVDRMILHPQRIEEHFGMTRGHIHHVDNSFGFADRLPYATPIAGLYSCSAGCHPAGAVIGAAGHNSALRVARDLGK